MLRNFNQNIGNINMYTELLIQNIPISMYFLNNEKISSEAKWKWRKDFSLNKYRTQWRS